MKHVSLLIGLIFVSIQGFGQHLTISVNGETGTSGTNWSITGNVLQIASSGTAAIHPSVITNHLTNTGDLTLVLPHNGSDTRNLYVNNSIAYTGSTARTLTFNSTNDIIFASTVGITSSNASLNLVFRTALSLSNIDHGRIALNQSTINTNGGHVWMGGGSGTTTWNGLTVGNSMARTWGSNLAGVSILNSTITTNGGNFYMYGRSHVTGDQIGTSNYGSNIENSAISTNAGSIVIGGDLLGKYINGIGTRIVSETTATNISTTSGTLTIVGTGYDSPPDGNSWRAGSNIYGINSTIKTVIKSVSGSIFVEGNANFTATVNDKEGIIIGGFSEITSQSGNISVKGTNSLENSGQFSNSIRFATSNTSNSIKIGYDGTNSYSGNIIIEGNSIYQRYNNAGTGSISIQSTGSLTIQPTSASFSYVRAGDSGTLTFDDDWNFGTTLSSFTYGKTTTTSDISFSNALTVAGAITFNVGTMSINSTLTSTATTGTGIELNGMKIVHNAGNSVLTQGSNIKYTVVNSPVTAANDYGINFLGILASSLKAIINANGGNIDILSSFSTSGVSGGSDRAIIVNYTDILTANSGTINIVGDATNNIATSTCWGFQFINTLVKNNSGSITITGTGGKATPNSRGIAVDASVLRVLSQSGDIIISDLKPVGLTGAYNGGYYNTPTTSDMFIGADGTNIVSSSSNITFKGDKNTFLTSASGGKQFKCTTSGNVIVESIASSFDAVDLSGFKILGTPAIVRLGKTTNTANVTVSNSIATSGAISVYGNGITLNDNIASSSNGDILLSGSTLNVVTGKTITSGGKLLLQPQIVGTTIGIAGAAGTLQLPATYFSTNFTDGFSSIQIGSSLQTGSISMNGFTLKDPIHFQTSGNLALIGLPILGNNSVTLDAGIASITGTPTNYFKTTGTGKVIRTISNAATFEFPIGNSSYNPLSIANNTGTSDVFSANVMDALYVNGVSGTAVSSTAVNRTWDISKTNANAGSGVDFVFNWNAGDVANGSFYLPEMNHFSGSAWEVPVVSSSTVGTNALTVVGYMGTFSPFSIQEGSGLPVELTLFNTNCSEIGTKINWQTASEHNSATFEVEKSRDGSNWNLIETVQAAGNSTTLVDYTVVDSEKATDVVYYRLNQIDLDGERKIYGPISANCIEIIDFKATVFPNPAAGMVTVEMNTTIAQTVSIQICGTDGKAIIQTTNTLEQGTTQIPLSVERLKAGVYTVKVNGENASKTIKLVVQ